MSASLVGSEMCIRDRSHRLEETTAIDNPRGSSETPHRKAPPWAALRSDSVSYTHLTLPTICSV
eukprot:11542086-Alexandrium_andersonii.AAC.1